MPSSIYKNMVNLIVGFPIWRRPVYLWMLRWGNIMIWTVRFLVVAKFTALTPLSLLISCKLSFPIVGLKMSFQPTLALDSHNKIFICNLGNLSNTRSNYSQKLSFTSSVLSSVGAWTFRTMIWHQRTLSVMYDILSLTNSTVLTADMILLCTKRLYLIHDSHFPFRRKMYILLLVRCHRLPIWPPAFPLNVTHILIVILIPSLVNRPYTNF
jgi:hypothetical protein